MILSTAYDKYLLLLFTTKKSTNFRVVPGTWFNGSTGVIGYADSELINANNFPSYRGPKARVQV